MSYDTLVSVCKLQVISNSTSSIIQAGESEHVYLYKRGISVERDITNSIGNMPMFAHYPMFSSPLPELTPLFPNTTIIQNNMPVDDPLTNKHAKATITIGRLNVISNSSSSYIHAGNSHSLFAESRSKTMLHVILTNGKSNSQKNKGPSRTSS